MMVTVNGSFVRSAIVVAALVMAGAATDRAMAMGEQAPAVVQWSMPEHAELPADKPVIGLVAFHMNGIEKVEFIIDGKVIATANAETRSPVTAEYEYVGNLTSAQLKAGATFTVTAKVYPTADKGKVTDVAPRVCHIADPATRKLIHVDVNGDDEAGDGSQAKPLKTIAKALSLAKGGDHILLHDGAYALTAEKDYSYDRFVTIRPADGADARITATGNLRCGLLKLDGLHFDWRGNNTHAILFGYSAPHYWIRHCRFLGTKGQFDNYTRAIKFWGKTTHITVERCEFRYLDVAIAAPPHAILRGNTIADMTSDAFDYNTENLVTGNTVHDLHAPTTFVTSTTAEPFDFTGNSELVINHRETREYRTYTIDLSSLANGAKATATNVADAMNKAFDAARTKGEFGLSAAAADGKVKITCLRTNYVQHIYFGGSANKVLKYAADSEANEVKGSGQHADVFQSWGGEKHNVIIRNNLAYDNHSQQWLTQDTKLVNVAFYNNLMDVKYESSWGMMFSGKFDNVTVEYNTLWNTTSTIILRNTVFEGEPNRDTVFRNNIIGIGTGLTSSRTPDEIYVDYNIYDYYRGNAEGIGPHSIATNLTRQHPTQSGLFAKVKVTEKEGGNCDFYAEAGDFSPAPKSPAVDAADGASGILYDINWNPRDAKPDIGAFELQK